MTEDDLIKYNIKNTDTYEDKYIATLSVPESSQNSEESATEEFQFTPEIVKSELEKVANTIIPRSNSYTCIIADTIGNGETGGVKISLNMLITTINLLYYKKQLILD